MIVEPVPTRAEVSDVATAVYEGADAIMLSAESAAGAWPEKAVATMDKIAQSAEGDSFYRGIMNAQRNDPQPTPADAISTAARSISETLDCGGNRELHGVRLNRHAGGARTAQCADHHPDANSCDRETACPCLGPALRAHAKRQ